MLYALSHLACSCSNSSSFFSLKSVLADKLKILVFLYLNVDNPSSILQFFNKICHSSPLIVQKNIRRDSFYTAASVYLTLYMCLIFSVEIHIKLGIVRNKN